MRIRLPRDRKEKFERPCSDEDGLPVQLGAYAMYRVLDSRECGSGAPSATESSRIQETRADAPRARTRSGPGTSPGCWAPKKWSCFYLYVSPATSSATLCRGLDGRQNRENSAYEPAGLSNRVA